MKREEFLELVRQTVCDKKIQEYGKVEDNFNVIATFWNNYIGQMRFTERDVAVMMMLVKIARISTGKNKLDNYVDIAGYAACAADFVVG